MFPRVINRSDFPRTLVLDKWTCNSDGRQAVFAQNPPRRGYVATFIDQGYCFNAGEWTFPDLALHGVYYRNYVYAHVRGWESFEPWLGQIEKCNSKIIEDIAGNMPPEWNGHDWDELRTLVKAINARREKVRE